MVFLLGVPTTALDTRAGFANLSATLGADRSPAARSRSPPVQFATTRPVTSAVTTTTAMPMAVSFQGFQPFCVIALISSLRRVIVPNGVLQRGGPCERRRSGEQIGRASCRERVEMP